MKPIIETCYIHQNYTCTSFNFRGGFIFTNFAEDKKYMSEDMKSTSIYVLSIVGNIIGPNSRRFIIQSTDYLPHLLTTISAKISVIQRVQ